MPVWYGFSFAHFQEVISIAIDMGVARGHIDLDFSSMKQSVSSAVQELKKLERQDALVDSELNKLRQTAALTGKAVDEQAEQIKLLSSELQTAKSRAETYKKGMEDMKSTIQRAAQEQKILTAKYRKIWKPRSRQRIA